MKLEHRWHGGIFINEWDHYETIDDLATAEDIEKIIAGDMNAMSENPQWEPWSVRATRDDGTVFYERTFNAR